MDPRNEILLGTLMLIIGLLFIRDGWLVFIKNRTVLSLVDKLFIKLALLFQGENQATKFKAQKSEQKIQEGVAFRSLIYGGMMLMAGFLFLLDAIISS